MPGRGGDLYHRAGGREIRIPWVRLLGGRDNPYSLLRRSGVLVLSSDFEGYPLVIEEALALGRPVISVDCPTGPREALQGSFRLPG